MFRHIGVCVLCVLWLKYTLNYFNNDNNLCVNRRNSQPIECYAPPNRSVPARSDPIDPPPLLLLWSLSICFVVRFFRWFFFVFFLGLHNQARDSWRGQQFWFHCWPSEVVHFASQAEFVSFILSSNWVRIGILSN